MLGPYRTTQKPAHIIMQGDLWEVGRYYVMACFSGYEWNAGFHRGRWGFGIERDPSGIAFRFGPLLFRKWR